MEITSSVPKQGDKKEPKRDKQTESKWQEHTSLLWLGRWMLLGMRGTTLHLGVGISLYSSFSSLVAAAMLYGITMLSMSYDVELVLCKKNINRFGWLVCTVKYLIMEVSDPYNHHISITRTPQNNYLFIFLWWGWGWSGVVSPGSGAVIRGGAGWRWGVEAGPIHRTGVIVILHTHLFHRHCQSRQQQQRNDELRNLRGGISIPICQLTSSFLKYYSTDIQ